MGMGGLKSYKVVIKKLRFKKEDFLVLLGDGGNQFPAAELGEPVHRGFVGFASGGGLPEIDFLHFVFLLVFLTVIIITDLPGFVNTFFQKK